MDMLLSTGEQVTIALLCLALQEIGCAARSYTGAQVHILTDSSHSKARIMDRLQDIAPPTAIADAADAITHLESGRTRGKISVTVDTGERG